LTRRQQGVVTYWRGNDLSLKDPIVYENFVAE